MKKIYDSRKEEAMAMLTFANLPGDQLGKWPLNWMNAFVGMGVRLDERQNAIGTNYDKVIYVYNCNAYAVDAKGMVIPGMPVYHAAVIFCMGDEIQCVLMVKSTELLDFMRNLYGPSRIIVNGQKLSECWNNVTVEIKDYNQEPILGAAGITQDFCVISRFGWEDESERTVAKRVQVDLGLPHTGGNYITACCYQLCTPDFEIYFHYVHMKIYDQDQQIVLTQRDELESEIVAKLMD